MIEDFFRKLIYYLDGYLTKESASLKRMKIPEGFNDAVAKKLGHKYQILNLETDKEYILDLTNAFISGDFLCFADSNKNNFKLVRK